MWELRLAWSFHQLGLHISEKGQAGPDITLETKFGRVRVEAVAPATSEELIQNEQQSIVSSAPIPEDEMILKATAVIKAKREAYDRYRTSGLVNPQDPYIIAISGANIAQAAMSDETPWILEPLCGRGQLYMRLDWSGVQPRTFGWERVMARPKTSGAPVPSALFADHNAGEVSAILFSPCPIESRPEAFGKPCGTDFLFVHNPFATNRIPVGFLPRGIEYGFHEGTPVVLNDWRMQVTFGTQTF